MVYVLVICSSCLRFVFFFQAEDGIRALYVTGVQTCALPIYDRLDDSGRGRTTMREAADAFGAGARRDTTLRMLASEASANLAWDVAVEALKIGRASCRERV